MKTMTKMRKKTTRTNSPYRFLFLFALPALLAVIGQPGQSQQKPPTKLQEYAIVAGTVFRDPGFAQPGATVILATKSAPQKKLQQQISDARGEFSFRVPPGPQSYVVTATLKGFKLAGQELEIAATEQINATLLLVPESKK
jgi:hypothetical protein